MKRLLSVFLFLLISAAAFTGMFFYGKREEMMKRQQVHPQERVVVYTDIPSGLLEALSDAFYAEQGIRMDIQYFTPDQLQNGAAVEGKPADVYLSSQETLLKLKDTGRTVPYSSSQTDTALNIFKDDEGYWTGLWVDPVVFAVNNDFYRKHPAFAYTWQEVMTRQSVELSMTDFITSAMSSDLLMSLAEHFGINETFSLLKSGQNHLVQYGKYLSTPSRMAAMGKCDIGISGLNEALRTQAEKMPLSIVYPTDGSPWYLYGVGLSVNAAYPDRGRRLIDWLLDSSRYKSIMERNQYYYVYVNDTVQSSDVEGNEIYFWPLAKNYFDEGKKDLLSQWGEKVRFGGTT